MNSVRRRSRATRAVVLALGLVLVVAAVAATAGAAPTRSTALWSSVTIRLNQDYPSLDPMVDLARPQAFSVTGPLYDRLVTLSADGKSFVPYLASSWTTTAKRITFKVRSGVAKCTDGKTIGILDVLNSVKRHILVPKRTGSLVAAGIGGWGSGPYHISANVKKSTLTLSVDKPYRNLLTPFASLPIICPAGLEALKTNPRALEEAAYGSGPYTLVTARHADRVEYKVRPEWNWGPKGALTGKDMPTTLAHRVIADDTTAANLLLTGELDIAEITGPDVARLDGAGTLRHEVVKNYYTDDLAFNQRPGRPLSGPEGKALRQAISTVVDPKAWNQASNAGLGEVATGWFRKGVECYDPTIAKLMPTPSLDKAKQILTSAGYTYSGTRLLKDGKQIAIDLLTTPLANAGPDYLFTAVSSLGIDVTLRNLAGATYGTNFLAGNFDMTIVRGSQSNFDAGLNIGPKFGPIDFNTAWAGYGDAEFNRIVNAANQNPGQGGCKYFSIMQKKALEQAYNLPMAARNFEIFSRGIDTPAQSTGSVFPAFWFKKATK